MDRGLPEHGRVAVDRMGKVVYSQYLIEKFKKNGGVGHRQQKPPSVGTMNAPSPPGGFSIKIVDLLRHEYRQYAPLPCPSRAGVATQGR